MKRIFSFDAETNGLWGKAFAIAAIVFDADSNTVLKQWIGRCPISGDINPWVKENVLPELENIEVSHEDYPSLLEGFMKFYMEEKQDSSVLVHIGLPVEAKLFIDAHHMGIIGDWDAPYPLIDCAAIPEIGTSVDTYNAANGIVIPEFDGGTHNPLYDSYAAAAAYSHWLNSK